MIKNHQSCIATTLPLLPKHLKNTINTPLSHQCPSEWLQTPHYQLNPQLDADINKGICCDYTPSCNFQITFSHKNRKEIRTFFDGFRQQNREGFTQRCKTEGGDLTSNNDILGARNYQTCRLYDSPQKPQHISRINLKPSTSESIKPMGDIEFVPLLSISEFDVPTPKNEKNNIQTQKTFNKKTLNMTLITRPPIQNKKPIQQNQLQKKSDKFTSQNKMKNIEPPKMHMNNKNQNINTKENKQKENSTPIIKPQTNKGTKNEDIQQMNRILKEENTKLGQTNQTRKQQINYLLKQIQNLRKIVIELVEPSMASSSSKDASSSFSFMDQNLKKIQDSLSKEREGEKRKGDRKKIAEDIGSRLKKILGTQINISKREQNLKNNPSLSE